jgi:hypothetical protein
MPIYRLGKGADDFRSDAAPGWSEGSEVHGGNGSDEINTTGDNLLLAGDNGADILSATGTGNELNGGRGADQLFTVAGGTGLQADNVLRGGQGVDSFSVDNRSHLWVTNDTGLPGETLSEGDRLTGGFDVVADYEAGELLRLGATTDIGAVPLDAYRAEHQHLALQLGEYGVVQGDLADDGDFEVSSAGGDLLFVYNPPDGRDEQWYYGAVVLRDFTAVDSVLIG